MLGIRFTIGDVAPRGFAALRLAIWGAWRLFGPAAEVVVLVNTLAPDEARARTGPVPRAVRWEPAPSLPAFLLPHLDGGITQGTGWKLAPVRRFPDGHELALDNDVVLWRLPDAIAEWLAAPDRFLLAEDVRPCFGQFHERCGSRPLNSGIRGLPPGFDFERALRDELRSGAVLTSELDEQGLQVATLVGDRLSVVPVEDVTICSPFPPHVPHLGRCGAHFVGLNAHELPFHFYDQPATAVRAEHWDALAPRLQDLVAGGEIDGERIEPAGAAPRGA